MKAIMVEYGGEMWAALVKQGWTPGAKHRLHQMMSAPDAVIDDLYMMGGAPVWGAYELDEHLAEIKALVDVAAEINALLRGLPDGTT